MRPNATPEFQILSSYLKRLAVRDKKVVSQKVERTEEGSLGPTEEGQSIIMEGTSSRRCVLGKRSVSCPVKRPTAKERVEVASTLAEPRRSGQLRRPVTPSTPVFPSEPVPISSGDEEASSF